METVQLIPLVRLPSGAAVRAERIIIIARKEIGQYRILFDRNPFHVDIDIIDLEYLVRLGAVQDIDPAIMADIEKNSASKESKIEVAG
jgi:hypothetical protein